MTKRKALDQLMTILLWSATGLIVFLLLAIITYIFVNGYQVLSWSFLTESPRDNMTRGGISTPLIGTLQLVLVSMFFALPVGIATGLYLAEYSKRGRFTSLLRLAIRSLAGVPSVVFGLFGLSLFVILLRFGSSLLSAGLTLGCLALPLIVTASEQAFLAVPQDYRDASYALGASKWQTIWKVVLPSASSTIITGGILSIGRVAGETAPIIFTGAAYFTPSVATSLFDEVMALPYHIMVLATEGTNITLTRPIQYGTVLVLLAFVLGISAIGVIMRARLRQSGR
ncbi:MAG: phosphate ABC transporter permease PstA [Aminobacterium sp.]|jgi:phosphate transport system permease protein|uniref:phosphate ABC transporter permease PstA n=1 Tax=unclassified Aminobacterium TaxID=2685012 RepID=UPI001BD001E7|nr:MULTISPECIES: phosphate ABC transporter permease PstA [unclassified Aminobacterium]MDD2207577.1 phosphate ABC transporter permease PstA [Aminobacterium sp.]MDD3426836.1 phosphate ABC transporter permease PstA [Aminobacterium sp.]MDD3708213.1 phosphate ABC transporter permease PstA [Aminobacterium sp.]MDD4229549.1 phosphate ABC transporter permease PstA [Aminobacterium sp.]MDD4552416.1 phosphate ABC transporter permease PstA [Aminobacterium sp.]